MEPEDGSISPLQRSKILDLELEPDLFETEPMQQRPGFADDDPESDKDEDEAAHSSEILDLDPPPLLRLKLIQALKCHLPPFPSASLLPPKSPLICSICLVAPLTYPTTVTLPCSHAFCAPCLRSWVNAAATPSEPSCPLCRTPLRYSCGHAIPSHRLVGGAQFTLAQLSWCRCCEQVHANTEARRRLFLRRVCAGHRPVDPALDGVTPELLKAAAAYLGSWRIGARLLRTGRTFGSPAILEMGLGELERHVKNVGRFVGVVIQELGIVEEKLGNRDGNRPLDEIERVALGHIRRELRRVERKLRRSARRTEFRIEAIKQYFSSPAHWLW
ncbi:hypothetical protein F4809DRAFT_244368 [Biscogniauxia mediterranea]|nr:hypothetical protein F4809DRAFT_244368 [Biscogniauxia mediterranea]